MALHLPSGLVAAALATSMLTRRAHLPRHATALSGETVTRPGRRHLPTVCTVLVGLTVTAVVAAFVENWANGERRHVVAQASAEHVEALKGRLIGSLEVLYAIESLLEARKEVTRQEFRDFVTNTASRHREIQGLAWDPRVLAGARTEWEARARQDGFGGFQIVEQAQSGRLIPAGQRPEYFPVFFMENLRDNTPALGFDVLSEERRRIALERARDTGLATATSPIRLVQERESQLGFLVLLPIYDRPVSSVEERRANLRGFAVAVCGSQISPGYTQDCRHSSEWRAGMNSPTTLDNAGLWNRHVGRRACRTTA